MHQDRLGVNGIDEEMPRRGEMPSGLNLDAIEPLIRDHSAGSGIARDRDLPVIGGFNDARAAGMLDQFAGNGFGLWSLRQGRPECAEQQ